MTDASSRRRPRLGLRGRFLLYLLFLHGVFAVIAVVLLRDHRPWLLAAEAFFLLSAVVALRLVRALFEPLRMVRDSASFLQERDFATRLRETDMPELATLLRTYNELAEQLREERIRNQEQEGFLQKILAASPLGALTLDFDGRIATVNRAASRMLGVAEADLLGRRLDDMSRPDGAHSADSATSAATASDVASARGRFVAALAELGVGESVVLPLTGRRRVRCYKSELFDRGHARQFVLLEELTEELRRTEKAAYDRLIRLMSHEVNNTTGAVTSLLQSCLVYGRQLTETDRSEFSEALEVAIRRSSHMNTFMKRFADVIRLPAPRKVSTDLEQLVGTMIRLHRDEAQKRGIGIERQGGAGAVPVALDAAQMEQALGNILRNAIEAIDRDGSIVVRTAYRGGRAQLDIADSGPGLSPEARDNLFTPFYTTKPGGQGIGLTLVREILEAHGFEYGLESATGKPTRFRIVL